LLHPQKLAEFSVAALLIAAAQAPLASTLIAVALPSISLGLGVDLVWLTGLLVTGYLLVNVVSQGPGGKLSDLFGHSRTLKLGMGLYAIGALIGLLAPGVALLLLSRCTMAVAGALVVPATLALLRLHVPPDARGRVFGLFGATMGVSAAFGPVLGGELVSWFGWRSIFFSSLPFLALAALLLYFHPLPGRPSPSGRTWLAAMRAFDVPGVGLLTAALSILIVATRQDAFWRIGLVVLALLAGIAFVLWELRAKEPVIEPRLFLHGAFAAGSSIIALQNFAMYGLLFQLPQYFERLRGASPHEVGSMLFVMMIGMVIASPLGGRLTDGFGARKSALLGVVPLLVGSLMLCRLESFVSTRDALPALLLFGLGMGLCSAPPQSSAMSSIPPEQAGMAAGASSTMRYLGSISTILVMGMVLGRHGEPSAERHQLLTWIFASAVGVSALISLRLPGGAVNLSGK